MAHDPGDEHRDPPIDPVNGWHLTWPRRDESHNHHTKSLGTIVRCGQLVPRHWATNVPAIVGCPDCLELAESPRRMQ